MRTQGPTQLERADEARIAVLEAKAKLWTMLGFVSALAVAMLTIPAIIASIALVKYLWGLT